MENTEMPTAYIIFVFDEKKKNSHDMCHLNKAKIKFQYYFAKLKTNLLIFRHHFLLSLNKISE